MAEVIEALRHGAAHWPSRIAFRDHAEEVTYGSLARLVAGAMEMLRGNDAPVGLMAENSIGWVIADLAVTASGRRFVPLVAADPLRLPNGADWGRYYDRDPWVCLMPNPAAPSHCLLPRSRMAIETTEIHLNG